MSDSLDEITALALATKSGEAGAAAAFVTATRADVRRFLVHLAGPGDADDLMQETYLRAMAALPRFAARSSARTWLLSIARRVAADHIRTLRRRPRTAGRDDWAEVADAARARRPSEGQRFDDAVAIVHLIEALPDERRVAFVATQMLGLSYAEAAEVCDVPIGTIRSRVARAREDLVAALAAAESNGAQSSGAKSSGREPSGRDRPTRHLRALG